MFESDYHNLDSLSEGDGPVDIVNPMIMMHKNKTNDNHQITEAEVRELDPQILTSANGNIVPLYVQEAN